MQPQIRLRRLVAFRIVQAGIFGGVAAADTLAALANSGPEQDNVVGLTYDAIRTDSPPEAIELKKSLVDLDGAYVGLLDWPKEFWHALHMLWKLHQHEDDTDLKLRTHLNAGVSRNVARCFWKFMQRVERVVLATGRNPLHRYESVIRQQLGLIHLVLERLPSKWESYIRKTIQFSIPFSEDPRENSRILKHALSSKLDKEYDLRITDKGPSSLYPEEKSTHNGLYDAAKRVIVFFPGYTPAHVAHEIGHAVWEAGYSPIVLKGFLRRSYNSAKKAMRESNHIPKDIAELELFLKQRVEEFFSSYRRRLNGLHLRRPHRFVHKMVSSWGKQYADSVKKAASIRAIGAQLDEYQGKVLDLVIEDNKEFLASWDEHWAEGFVHVLLRHIDTDHEELQKGNDSQYDYNSPVLLPDVPFAILSLIREILAL